MVFVLPWAQTHHETTQPILLQNNLAREISMELSWRQACFHGSVKTFDDWIWQLSEISKFCSRNEGLSNAQKNLMSSRLELFTSTGWESFR